MSVGETVRSLFEKATGISATVVLQWGSATVRPGDEVEVEVIVTPRSNALECKGVHVELHGIEEIDPPSSTDSAAFAAKAIEALARAGSTPANGGGGRPAVVREPERPQFMSTHHTVRARFRIADACRIENGASHRFTGRISIPELQPSYRGVRARHRYEVRARVILNGVDPTSDVLAVVVRSR